jgi:hypothetical protein
MILYKVLWALDVLPLNLNVLLVLVIQERMRPVLLVTQAVLLATYWESALKNANHHAQTVLEILTLAWLVNLASN